MRSILLAIGIAFIFIFSAPLIHAQTIDMLLIQIQEMQKQVLELQNQLQQLSVAPVTPLIYVFEKDLKVGTQNEDVKKLQEVLTNEGIYSGPITGYFGPLTKAAVIKFQEKYSDEILKPLNLTKGTGFFGLSTRKKINKIFAAAERIDIGFTVNGSAEDITVLQGSPMLLAWDVKDVDPFNIMPCEAAVDERNFDGNLIALSDYYYSWIGPQPVSGSAEVLAYSILNNDRPEIIFKLVCDTIGGKRTGSVSVKVVKTDPASLEEQMIITMLANGVGGKSVAKISVADLQGLNLSWTAKGDAYPAVCTLSDIGNVIIAKNLSPRGSYSINNPQVGQHYYINCIDADGEYAFDGVELVE